MHTLAGEIRALFLGPAREIATTGTEAWWDKPWTTGFCKDPHEGECWLRYEGLAGDEQADRRYHGGVDKAVCVYPHEHYPAWRETLPLPELPHGAFGENFTVAGLPESAVCIGDIFSVGTARVQVSQPRQPCWKLARRWRIKDLALQVERTGRTGYYFRVLQHGHVRPGDRLQLEQRPCPEWTIARCNELMHHAKDDRESARLLSQCIPLSGSWKDTLWARATHPTPRDTSATRLGL